MPDLAQSLGRYDLGYLQIAAQLWGLEFSASELNQGIERLVPIMLDEQLIREIIESLPMEAQTAIADLVNNGGRLAWSFFKRRYGEVREMGAGRRDRDKPFLEPISTAELLFYRALIGRAFYDTSSGPEEFAYIPDDFLPLLKSGQVKTSQPLGREARPAEHDYVFPVSDHILADACTMLAGMRMGLEEIDIHLFSYPGEYPHNAKFLQALLNATGLLDETGMPHPERTRHFLEAESATALTQLANSWKESKQLNELALLPGLILEGEWRNDPILAREEILRFLETVSENTWWHIKSFVEAIHQQFPDFQRPAGDYDSWFIRKAGQEEREEAEYLRGFENWDQVEGRLIQFMITGPLHWLGILDLAAPAKERPPAVFRKSRWAAALLEGESPDGLPHENAKVLARSDAKLILSVHVPRSARYQIARFSQWEKLDQETYQYRLSPSSLSRASESGLRTSHLLAILERHAEAVPPSLVKALEHWDKHGRQARIEGVHVLRLSSPDILQELRASRAARFLGDPLGPTAVIVKTGAQEKVLTILSEMGYLGEIITED